MSLSGRRSHARTRDNKLRLLDPDQTGLNTSLSILKAIADLVPAESVTPKDKSAAVEKFQAFIRKNPVSGGVNIKQLVDDGRM